VQHDISIRVARFYVISYENRRSEADNSIAVTVE